MWQRGLCPQTRRVWASKILLTNKTPLTKTNSQFPISPNKPTQLSVRRWRLGNRGRTLGRSCLLPPLACRRQLLRPLGRGRAGPRPPGSVPQGERPVPLGFGTKTPQSRASRTSCLGQWDKCDPDPHHLTSRGRPPMGWERKQALGYSVPVTRGHRI